MFPRFGIEGIEVRGLSNREREMLIEEATTAWRSRSPDGRTLEHHTWADLDAAARQTVFADAFIMRVLKPRLIATRTRRWCVPWRPRPRGGDD